MSKMKINLSDYVDNLIDLAESIPLNKITILTGSNGSGKSFIRKIAAFKITEKKTGNKEKSVVSSTSMQQRTETNAEWGALSGIMHDTSWTPTSMNTWHLIKQVIEHTDRFIIIDEPEIGLGEETLLGLINHLNQRFKARAGNSDFYGAMVITHSRLVVQNLKHDHFINIDGLTETQWLKRELKPANLEEIESFSNEVFREIQDRINSKSKNSN